MNEIEKAQQEITEARDKLASAEARLSALSKPEKEYRAGEWVPKDNQSYWCVHGDGQANESRWGNDSTDQGRINYGNVYPTKSIAEAAKAHADWWREFDLIVDKAPGDKPKAECGRGYVTYKTPDFNIGHESTQRLGGEQKVIDMLNRGRVFRFKWGGQ